jgi:uncharacterized protein
MSGHNLQHALPVEGGVDPAYSLQSGDGELRELQAHAARLVEGGVDSDLPPLCGVVLKVAAPCNLNCSYCYVYHGADQTYRSRPPLFSEALAHRLASQLKQYCSTRPGLRMGICFHGGEPLLLGMERFRDMADLFRDQLGPSLARLSVQTNGVLVDAKWAQLFRDLDLTVGVSLDGPAEVNDRLRVDHGGRGSHARIVAGIRHLLGAGVEMAVLCVVQPGASGAEAYRHIRSLGVKSLDFLLPDVTHDGFAGSYGHLGPTPAADFLIPALDAWMAEDNPAIKVRFFGDMFRLILGGKPSTDAFGGNAMPYVVIETDGSIQANDPLRVCEESTADTGLNILTHTLEDLGNGRREALDFIRGAVPRPDACVGCREFDTCGGGFMPHRYSRRAGFNNPSVWCADILKLFGHMRRLVGKCEPAEVA